jgi:cell division protein FtsI/penicillin-binding protein 2
MTATRPPRLQRAAPVLALAAVTFAVGAIVGAHAGSDPDSAAAKGWAQAWARGEWAHLYTQLDAGSRRSLTPEQLREGLERGLRTATATSVRVTGSPRRVGPGSESVPVTVSTRLFGTLALQLEVPLVDSEGGSAVRWSPALTFPGLHEGETLTRRTVLPRRAAVLARDGSTLAEASEATASSTSGESTPASPLGEAARPVVGTVGPIPASHRAEYEAQGVPPDALVGLSGLERALDARLRGVPGGELLAGTRVLATAAPRAAAPVRTSVSPGLQHAAVAALGGLYGGVVALQPSTGQVLAVAGIGLEGLQPPGSTFKMITVSGVLSAGIANPKTVFPYATYATLDGVRLHNANGEECGGSLELAFAVSCNSVFSPLGVRLGAPRLVSTAEAFGFNHDLGLEGAPRSTLPAASSINGELDLGSTAIGQGEVLATPLQMATVAATIGDGGMRPQLTFAAGGHAQYDGRAISAEVARTVRHLMIGVVRSGTGTAAAIPGVTVAGKTGTAELKTQCQPQEGAAGEHGSECQGGEAESSNTDAWFAAFAPAIHPRVAVCVMLVKDGAGGATAAPVAREVLVSALQSG